ncbi:MAG: hypothetical protein HRU34_19820 [Richelia sp.]|nr:hypothetical protein [Richelia sp.]
MSLNEGYTFTHSHAEQEEVYIVIAGRSLIIIDRELITIEGRDLLRLYPSAKRGLKAAEDRALFVICTGAVAAACAG